VRRFIVLGIAIVTFSLSFVFAESVIETAISKKQEFIKTMDQEIAKLTNEIESLRVKAKDKSSQTIERLEVKKDQLQGELKKLKKSSAKASSKLEVGVKKAWTALKESVQSAKEEFQE
jgi:glutamine synthetase type III